LNAKFHEREAEYVAQAGAKGGHHRHQHVGAARHSAGRNPEFMAKQELVKKGIAQQCAWLKQDRRSAGRWYVTSIFYYNGNEYTVPTINGPRSSAATKSTPTKSMRSDAVGGLHILGTERHESRRHRHQLRGRAGRQGDSPAPRAFISRWKMTYAHLRQGVGFEASRALGMEEGVPIESKLISRRIERRRRRLKGSTLNPASTCSNTTT